jgi:transposase-like protein
MPPKGYKQKINKQARPKLFKSDIAAEIKAEAMLAHRAAGASYREIAEIFEMSDLTARKWVDRAKQAESLGRAKGIVGARLVPKAIAVYDQQLDAGNLEAARDILFGAGVLLKQAKMEVSAEAVDPLAAFRQKYFSPPEEPKVEVTVEPIEQRAGWESAVPSGSNEERGRHDDGELQTAAGREANDGHDLLQGSPGAPGEAEERHLEGEVEGVVNAAGE